MIRHGPEVRARHDILYNGIGLYLFDLEMGKRKYASKVNYEEYQPFTTHSPTIILEDHMSQQLMNDLWEAGVRPSMRDDPGAVGKHLDDMRKIAFKFLEISS